MNAEPTASLMLADAIATEVPVTLTVTGTPDDVAAVLVELALRWPVPDVLDDLLADRPSSELEPLTVTARLVLSLRSAGDLPWPVRRAVTRLWTEAGALGADCPTCATRRGTWCRTASGTSTGAHVSRRQPVIREAI